MKIIYYQNKLSRRRKDRRMLIFKSVFHLLNYYRFATDLHITFVAYNK